MFYEWQKARNSLADRQHILADLYDVSTSTVENINFALCHFITEIRKVDGTDFPPRTLYQTIICVQFHLEKLGLHWKSLDDDKFVDDTLWIT